MLSALDLFAGAGGFSYGMSAAGINVVAAVEMDKYAVQTYRANHPATRVFHANVAEISDEEIQANFRGIEVLFGGPPCQGFSVAGPSQYGKVDERNELLFQFVRFARILRPEVIVVENVKGILNGRVGSTRGALGLLGDALSKLGYSCNVLLIRAADWGVPQTRERVFLFARRNLNFSVDLLRIPPGRRTSVWEAFSDLPALDAIDEPNEEQDYHCSPSSAYQREMRVGSAGVWNHVPMKHTARIVKRLEAILPGQSLKDVSVEHGQRKRNSQEIDKTMRYKMNCYRLDPNSPAITLPANFQTIHVHPFLNRMLTAREGARLQSFPDTYHFCGPRTLMSKKLLEREGRHDEIGLSQYNQIGNAVPPLVAKAIGDQIIQVLEGRGFDSVARFA